MHAALGAFLSWENEQASAKLLPDVLFHLGTVPFDKLHLITVRLSGTAREVPAPERDVIIPSSGAHPFGPSGPAVSGEGTQDFQTRSRSSISLPFVLAVCSNMRTSCCT